MNNGTRVIWKGAISFGLVNIPIALRAGVRHEELAFRLLRKSDLSPVNYKRVAETDGKEVPWDQIVKGYEYEPGRFVVLKEEDFRRVDLEAAQTVGILDFVFVSDINPMFFHKPYFMEPLKGAAKAYELLRAALQNSAKIGIAKVVIKSREHLAAVKAQGGKLILELMHFADDLADPAPLAEPKPVAGSKQEVAMTRALIEQMTVKWDPGRYQDDYRSGLMGLIEQKIKSGGHEMKSSESKPKRPANVIDLADVLRKSLEESRHKLRVRKPDKPTRPKKAA